jgi:hypothetical protein
MLMAGYRGGSGSLGDLIDLMYVTIFHRWSCGTFAPHAGMPCCRPSVMDANSDASSPP